MDFDDRLLQCRKTGSLLRWLAGFFVLVLAVAVYSVWRYGQTPGPLNAEATVYIQPRSSFSAIEGTLAAAQVIRPDSRFRWYARLRGVAHRLKAGEFVFQPGQTPGQVLQVLASGKVVRRKVTIPEGYTIAQIAALLETAQLADRARFTALAKDRRVVERMGLEAESLEGYLFPDTYYFARGQESLEIIETMVDRMLTVLDDLVAHAPSDPGLTPHQVLTLASIVEKETGQPVERPLIASVFLNRLKRGMRLQADPTVIYGIRQFDGNLTKKDLLAATPYNTYVIKGLPPGPIASPGREAIRAVLDPAPEPYLYFVSRNDGSHYFSATLAEHNRAVRRFQQRTRKK